MLTVVAKNVGCLWAHPQQESWGPYPQRGGRGSWALLLAKKIAFHYWKSDLKMRFFCLSSRCTLTFAPHCRFLLSFHELLLMSSWLWKKNAWKEIKDARRKELFFIFFTLFCVRKRVCIKESTFHHWSFSSQNGCFHHLHLALVVNTAILTRKVMKSLNSEWVTKLSDYVQLMPLCYADVDWFRLRPWTLTWPCKGGAEYWRFPVQETQVR